jgi:hypothetical protein
MKTVAPLKRRSNSTRLDDAESHIHTGRSDNLKSHLYIFPKIQTQGRSVRLTVSWAIGYAHCPDQHRGTYTTTLHLMGTGDNYRGINRSERVAGHSPPEVNKTDKEYTVLGTPTWQ